MDVVLPTARRGAEPEAIAQTRRATSLREAGGRRAEAAAGTIRRQHRHPSHQRTEVGAAAQAAAGHGHREAVPIYDKLAREYAAEPLLYNTTQCDDYSGVWCVFAEVRSAGCISGSEWAYHTPIWDCHISIGCTGMHIALARVGEWETKHWLAAGIDTYSIARWAETITVLSGVYIRRDGHLI